MACSLPQFILLKSVKKDKYLRYRKEDDPKHGVLQFSGDENKEDVQLQYVKFQVQKSETMEGYVHIRTLYNNKYWVRKSGDDESKSWIAAEANEPEEDPSKMSCTLFKPVLVDEDDGGAEEHDKSQKIRLVHIDQVGQQGCVALPDSGLLTLEGRVDDDNDNDNDGVFIAYNGASAFLLPDRVTFTNHEGKYGVTRTVNGQMYVDFNTDDIGTTGVVIELTQYAHLQPPLILCGYPNSRNVWNRSSVDGFIRVLRWSIPYYCTPIRLGGNKIAIQGDHDQSPFTNRVAAHGMTQVVARLATSITNDAIFGVQEPVRLSYAYFDFDTIHR